MGIVLVALILGLAIAIERIIYLNMATTNTKKLLDHSEFNHSVVLGSFQCLSLK